MTTFYPGIAGKRVGDVRGVVIHNDAGSQNATAEFYRNWLPNQEAENGFAHVYTASDGRYQPELYEHMAWHTGNSEGNANYIGWEVCQSMGDETTFLKNEQAVCKDIAGYMHAIGMTPTRDTVRLHKEFSATACPHRSWELHGQDVHAVKDYFIAQIKNYMNGTAPTEPETPSKRRYGYRVDDIQFINGLWQIRCNSLVPAGFDWTENGINATDIDMIDPCTGELLEDQHTIKKGLYFAFIESRVTDTGVVVQDQGYHFRKFSCPQPAGSIWLVRDSKQQLVYG